MNAQTHTPDPTPSPVPGHGLAQASGRQMAANLLGKTKGGSIAPHAVELEVRKVELYTKLVQVSPALIAAVAVPTIMLMLFRSSPNERVIQALEQNTKTQQALIAAQQQQSQDWRKAVESASKKTNTSIGLINLVSNEPQQQPAQQSVQSTPVYAPVVPQAATLYEQWTNYWQQVDGATFEASRQRCSADQSVVDCQAWANVAVLR